MQFIKTIRRLAGANKFDKALELLEDFAEKSGDSDLQTDVAQIKGRVSALKKQTIRDVNPFEVVKTEENKIRIAILELINSIPTIEEKYSKVLNDNSFQIKLSNVNLPSKDYTKAKSFWSWLLQQLSNDTPVTISLASVIFSFFFFFYCGTDFSKKEPSIFLYYGIIANFVVSLICFLSPLIGYTNNQKKSKIQLSSLMKYPKNEISIQPKDRESLKTLLGFETDFGFENSYKRAFSELIRFDKAWRKIWIGWIVLYLCWIFKVVIGYEETAWIQSIRGSSELDYIIVFSNGFAHLFMLFSFLILYLRREDVVKNNAWRFLFSILFFITFFSCTLGSDSESLVDSEFLVNNMSIISGSFAGLSVALLTGRLSSKHLNVPFWIILILYIYAIVQPSIDKFPGDLGLMAIFINFALLSKTLLFILLAWLTSTNRIVYYMIMINREDTELKANWNSISEKL